MDEQLVVLFPDGPGDRELAVPLPPGRAIVPEDATRPAYWVSDETIEEGLWSRLRDEHERSGLWPLLTDGLNGDVDRPWRDGEVWPAGMTAPADHDPATLLEGWWHELVGGDPDVVASIRPFTAFPGLAPGGPVDPDLADETAAVTADLMLDGDDLALVLVPAASGAEALAAAGWAGPTNHENDTGKLAAVLASWQRRFGARVVRADFDRLWVTVGATPSTYEQALPVAAEHFAFCPDNIWQSGHETIEAYARFLVDRPLWSFWWD